MNRLATRRKRATFLLCLALLLPSHALVAGCSGEPPSTGGDDAHGHRLVGTWQLDLTLDPRWEKRMARVPADAEKRKTPVNEATTKRDPEEERPMRLTFEKDGTFVMEGSVLGHGIRESARWKATAETADQLTIDVIDSSKGTTEPLTLVFSTNDVLVSETKLGKMYYRRVE